MKNKQGWTNKQKIFPVGGAVLLLAAVVLCCFAGPYVLELASQAERIRLWAQQYRLIGRLAYMGAVILQVILAVIPGEPLEIAGGYIFGAMEGTLLCLGAAAAGSMIVFYLVRRFGVRFAERFFSHEKLRALHFLQSSPKRIFLFWLIYLIPGTPKDLLCYYAGLTDIKPPVFLVICSVGRIPSLVTSTIGGDALGLESYLFALIVFGATLLISAVGLLVYRWICKRHETNG